MDSHHEASLFVNVFLVHNTQCCSILFPGFVDEPVLLLSLQVFMCRNQLRILWYKLLVEAKKVRQDKGGVSFLQDCEYISSLRKAPCCGAGLAHWAASLLQH
ncbi:hypothetical protein BT93_F0307 [Corymbia citriodora subsp. variegata]|nr:hypothetical protein BT93_F0307 [Corymbia citriodora subsp. variegata]